MKKQLSLLFLASALLLVGCGGNQNNNSQGEPVSPSNPSEPSDPVDPVDPSDPVDPVDPVDPIDPIDDEPVEEEQLITKIILNHTIVDILVSKKSYDELYVKEFVSSRELTLDEKEVTWYSEDESIFQCSSITGRITPKALGSAYIVCKSVNYDVLAKCMVNIVSSMDDLYSYEYLRVDDYSTLKDKDTIIIAAINDDVVATSNTEKSNLHVVAAEFDKNHSKIVSYDEELTETFYLGEEENGFTLQSRDGKYFAGFNEKRVGFVSKKGNIEWRFTEYEGQLYIETYNDVRGWLMFNKDLNNHEGGFTLYEREEPNDYVYMPTIFRLTKVNK